MINIYKLLDDKKEKCFQLIIALKNQNLSINR